jgi:hypothetical protein
MTAHRDSRVADNGVRLRQENILAKTGAFSFRNQASKA